MANYHPGDNVPASSILRVWDRMTELQRYLVDFSINVQGKVAPKAKSFAISLGKDAANLGICFKPDLSKGIIICSYKKEGKWDREMICLSCPFHEGEEVEISFFFQGTDRGSIVTVKLPDHTYFRFHSLVKLSDDTNVAVDGDFQCYPDPSL